MRVALRGELDLAAAPVAEAALAKAEATADGAGEIVIDLRELTFMDSTGLRLLVTADRRASAGGRALVVVRGPAEVQRVIEVTGLDGRLRLVDEP